MHTTHTVHATYWQLATTHTPTVQHWRAPLPMLAVARATCSVITPHSVGWDMERCQHVWPHVHSGAACQDRSALHRRMHAVMPAPPQHTTQPHTAATKSRSCSDSLTTHRCHRTSQPNCPLHACSNRKTYLDFSSCQSTTCNDNCCNDMPCMMASMDAPHLLYITTAANDMHGNGGCRACQAQHPRQPYNR